MLTKFALTAQASVAIAALISVASCAGKPPSGEAMASDQLAERLESRMDADISKQYDVLAGEILSDCQKRLKRARGLLIQRSSRIKEAEGQLNEAQKCLEHAESTASARHGRFEELLAARQAAIDSGARHYPIEKQKIGELDDHFRKLVEGGRSIPVEELSKLQAAYLRLEVRAVQARELGSARQTLEEARRTGGGKIVPQSFGHAERAVQGAENLVAAYVHNPDSYRKGVERANLRVQFLVAVLTEAKRGRNVVPEAAAIEIVNKNRDLQELKNKLDVAEANVEAQQSTIARQTAESREVKEHLKTEQVFMDISDKFNHDEAEVVRDGDKIKIRLKAIQFPFAKADLPQRAIPLLSKVKDAVKTMSDSRVNIEGHTDSIGSPTFNQKLSEKRADSVAKYLARNGIDPGRIQVSGASDEKPLATNRSKHGRSENRRVDIILTPMEDDGGGESKQIQ